MDFITGMLCEDSIIGYRVVFVYHLLIHSNSDIFSGWSKITSVVGQTWAVQNDTPQGFFQHRILIGRCKEDKLLLTEYIVCRQYLPNQDTNLAGGPRM